MFPNLDNLQKHMTSQFYKTQKVYQDVAEKHELNQSQISAITPMWMRIIYFIFVLVFSIVAYSLYQAKKELSQKKFI